MHGLPFTFGINQTGYIKVQLCIWLSKCDGIKNAINRADFG